MSPENFATTAYMFLVSVVGSAGNVLVILAIVHKRRLRTIPNYFLFNLAVCDLLNCSLAIPLRLVEGFQPGSIPCSVVIALTVLFDGLSRLNIIFISIDRFIAIKYPLGYSLLMTHKNATALITSGWLIMVVFSILPVMGVGSAPTEILSNNQGLCFFSTNLSKAYLLVFRIALCLLPLILATLINFFLLKTSHRQMRVIHDQQANIESGTVENNSLEISATNTNVTFSTNGEGTSSLKVRHYKRKILALRQRRVVKMVIILVGLFIILVLPITLIDLVSAFGESGVPPLVAKLAVCMIYTNTTVNVFVYAGFIGEFRRAFILLIRAGRARFVSLFQFAKC